MQSAWAAPAIGAVASSATFPFPTPNREGQPHGQGGPDSGPQLATEKSRVSRDPRCGWRTPEAGTMESLGSATPTKDPPRRLPPQALLPRPVSVLRVQRPHGGPTGLLPTLANRFLPAPDRLVGQEPWTTARIAAATRLASNSAQAGEEQPRACPGPPGVCHSQPRRVSSSSAAGPGPPSPPALPSSQTGTQPISRSQRDGSSGRRPHRGREGGNARRSLPRSSC